MKPEDRERVLLDVQEDRDRVAEEIELLQGQIAGLESEIEKLNQLESYLSKPSLDEIKWRTSRVLNKPSATDKLQAVTQEELEAAATSLMRERGESVKSLDVARRAVPEYHGDMDGRNFENRVYSYLDRRKSQFVKTGRGLFYMVELLPTDNSPADFTEDVDDAYDRLK